MTCFFDRESRNVRFDALAIARQARAERSPANSPNCGGRPAIRRLRSESLSPERDRTTLSGDDLARSVGNAAAHVIEQAKQADPVSLADFRRPFQSLNKIEG